MFVFFILCPLKSFELLQFELKSRRLFLVCGLEGFPPLFFDHVTYLFYFAAVMLIFTVQQTPMTVSVFEDLSVLPLGRWLTEWDSRYLLETSFINVVCFPDVKVREVSASSVLINLIWSFSKKLCQTLITVSLCMSDAKLISISTIEKNCSVL